MAQLGFLLTLFIFHKLCLWGDIGRGVFAIQSAASCYI